MLKNYFIIAWRNLLKNRVFSAINVLGLAIGIAAFLLIVNYLRFEYSFDKFNSKIDRIYRVPMTVTETSGKAQTFAFTYPAVAPAMKKDFPEIEDIARFRIRWGVVQHGEQKIIENGKIFFVDPSVFKIFSFDFVQGNPATAFAQLNDAVITESTAKKYFGTEPALGNKFRFNNDDYVVRAVIKDVPINSHIQFNILLNYNKYIQDTNGDANTSWGWSDFYTYALVKPGADIRNLQAKMPDFAQRYMGDRMKKEGFTVSFQLQPLSDIHTKSIYDYEMTGSGNLYYLKYLGVAAILILLIALINYVNLSTARSLERAKEVGVRKVVGATKYQLFRQFLTETFLMNILGILIGYGLFKIALPKFAGLINMNIIGLQSSDWDFWIAMFLIFITSTLVAGFYPAVVLSSFQPSHTLKSIQGAGGIKRSRNFLRKSLVVAQFAAAILLIGGAIGFYRQLDFMSKTSLGININQTLVLQQTRDLDSSKIQTVESIISDLQRIPGVENVTVSTDVPGGEVGNSTTFRQVSSNNDKRCRTFGIDEKFVPHYGLTIVAGRNFDRDLPNTPDTSQVLSVILNETASKVLGFEKPSQAVGQMLSGSGKTCRVIGVMNDYHQQSFQYNFDPIVYYPEQHIYMTNFSLKLNTKDLPRVVEASKKIWTATFPQSPLQYFFLDEFFNRQYKNDQIFSTILWWFTILAIVIASLGLLGLSLYTVAKRTKEIGIRKVLGASVFQITKLITKDYIQLVLIAGIISVPATYFLLHNWLNDYAFHIEVGPLFFALPLVLIICIALLTVLYQAIKAAIANPVNSLKNE
ncbi:MAG: ABC transporter permease [Bacteroidetes bacterium]|nr:MAG: ABC transporter permease [Bacteroidota bacterium]